MQSRIVGLVAAAVVPPVIVAGLRRAPVESLPRATVVLLVAYECAVVLAAFGGRIVGDVAKRWQLRIADHLDQILGRRMSRFPRRYRAVLLGRVRHVDLTGLPTIGFYTPELDEVYIHLSLAYRAPGDAGQSVLDHFPPDVTDRHALGDFLDSRRPVVLAIVGAPGSGKTTLLRRTARQICQAPRGRRRSVPILLFLRDHVSAVLASPQVTLADLVRETLDRGVHEPAGWFEQKLEAGHCMMLLDGLDEVARQDDRRAVASWVQRQVARYPENDYVITSRPQGYLSTPVNGAAVLQIRSLTDEQVEAFVRGWYLAVERFIARTEDTAVRRVARTAAEDLLERLNENPALLDLTINPLLLTMIANVHRHRGALPGTRNRLYGEICEVILWRRQESKGVPGALSGDRREILLRHLALAMMEQRVRDLPRPAVLTEVEPLLRRMSPDLSPEEFLAEVSTNGLLIERESGRYAFAHHTFQEYLAAARLHDTARAELLAATVDDVWWRETTLLYVVGSDADAIVEACLASGSVTALSLAFDCVEQDSHLDPRLRRRLDELLTSTYGSGADTDAARLRLMAEVTAMRQLRALVRTQGGGRVCLRPVTRGLYTLFRSDTGAPPPDGEAAREGTPEPAPGGPDNELPVTGVRAVQVVAFLRWLNGITSDGPGYRLPSLPELQDPAVRRGTAAVRRGMPAHGLWHASDGEQDRPRLWVAPGTPDPYEVDAGTMLGRVGDDLQRARPALVRLLLLRALVTVDVLLNGADGLRPAPGVAVEQALDHVHDLVQTLRHIRALGPGPGDRHATLQALADGLGEVIDGGAHRERAGATAAQLQHELVDTLRTREAVGRTDAVGLVLPVIPVPGLIPDGDHAFDRALEQSMGVALSSTVTRMLRAGVPSDSWTDSFARRFALRTWDGSTSWRVSPDDLAHRAREACRTIHGRHLTAQGGPDEPCWADVVTRRFEQAALSAFDGRDPITPVIAGELRIAALCLAAEADSLGEPEAGTDFRRIAIGVTLLEERAQGDRPPGEMIVLAKL